MDGLYRRLHEAQSGLHEAQTGHAGGVLAETVHPG